MGFCQWAMLIIWACSFCHAFVNDGEKEEISIAGTAVSIIVQSILLYCGGFFD